MSNAVKKQNFQTVRDVKLKVGKDITLEGSLCIPAGAKGLVMFVHGSGSSRHSPRNKYVAEFLNSAGLATLLFDLLTASEESIDNYTGQLRFDIDFLAQRVVEVTKSLVNNPETAKLKIGYFGASTGAAAALVAAAAVPEAVKAVVSRGGRPDLADEALRRVQAPTLLIVGARDPVVFDLNREAYVRLPRTTQKRLELIAHATHLFEEPGTLEQVASLAGEWFKAYL